MGIRHFNDDFNYREKIREEEINFEIRIVSNSIGLQDLQIDQDDYNTLNWYNDEKKVFGEESQIIKNIEERKALEKENSKKLFLPIQFHNPLPEDLILLKNHEES